MPDVGLWEALAGRRSARGGLLRVLLLSQVSTLLAYSLRIQEVGTGRFGEISFRPVASGGGRHPIDLYLVALRVEALTQSVYQYDPERHELISLSTPATVAKGLIDYVLEALEERPEPEPALVLLFVAVPERTACKYENLSLVTVMKDIGCLIQQLYLVCQGLGLRGCATGGVEPIPFESVLGLASFSESVVGGFLVW
jgi:SagB-type dehydrogenase family enzyme